MALLPFFKTGESVLILGLLPPTKREDLFFGKHLCSVDLWWLSLFSLLWGNGPKWLFGRKRLPTPALSHITYSNRGLLSSFQTKTFSLNPVLQIDTIIV